MPLLTDREQQVEVYTKAYICEQFHLHRLVHSIGGAYAVLEWHYRSLYSQLDWSTDTIHYWYRWVASTMPFYVGRTEQN
jgi:hypothetical protein